MKTKEEKIFEIRKNYIEKIRSWEEKTFYGVLLFFGYIITILITSNNSNWIIVVGIAALMILILEATSHIRLSKLYYELIQDIKNNKIEDFNKISFSGYLKGNF